MNDELDNFVGNDEVDDSATVEMTADSQAEEVTESAPMDTSEKGDTGEPPSPAEEKHQETMIPLAAKQAEKERRKIAEERARNAELELARLQGMQQAQQKPEATEVPDPYTDPEGYTKHVLSQKDAEIAHQNSLQLRARLESAEEVARVELTDYDKYAEYFATTVAPNNPQLVNMMKASPDPAKFAYYKGKQAMQEMEAQTQITQAGGLEAWRQQIAEEARAAVMAELETKKSPNIPPDLTSVRNTGSDPSAVEIAEGTDGLNQLLGR